MLQLAKNLFLSMSQLPHHSLSYRVLRALDTSSFSVSDRSATIEACNFPISISPPPIGKNARTKGNVDFHRMLHGEDPHIRTRKLQKVHEDDIEFMVLDICSEENVGTLSFGSKHVSIPGTSHMAVIPSLTRKPAVGSP